jgi:hypothetical protein
VILSLIPAGTALIPILIFFSFFFIRKKLNLFFFHKKEPAPRAKNNFI